MTFFAVIFFILGLVIGSFLNVVIYRFNTQKSFGGRSACMSCRNQLAWYELIPLFSYLGLKGRCSSCQTKISFQYPLVEFITGVLFLVLFFEFQYLFYQNTLMFIISYAFYTSIFSLLLVVTVYDIKHKIIPDVLSFVFGFLAFLSVFLFVDGVFAPHMPAISDFFGAIVISIPFALIWLLSRGTWMGLGDAKLAIGLGLLLGMPLMLSATVMAFWIGAVVGIFLLIFNKKYNRKSEVPFGPFLILGTLIAFLCELELYQLVNLFN